MSLCQGGSYNSCQSVIAPKNIVFEQHLSRREVAHSDFTFKFSHMAGYSMIVLEREHPLAPSSLVLGCSRDSGTDFASDTHIVFHLDYFSNVCPFIRLLCPPSDNTHLARTILSDDDSYYDPTFFLLWEGNDPV